MRRPLRQLLALITGPRRADHRIFIATRPPVDAPSAPATPSKDT